MPHPPPGTLIRGGSNCFSRMGWECDPGRPRKSLLLTNTRRCRAQTSPTAPFCSGPHTTSTVLCFREWAGKGNTWQGHSKGKGMAFGTSPYSSGETEAWSRGWDRAWAWRQEDRTGGEGPGPLGASVSLLETQSPCLRLCQAQAEKRASCHDPSPECGLFILGLSCRHSSTFFHRSGCPSPRSCFQASVPPSLPEAPKLGAVGEGGIFPTRHTLSLSVRPSPLASVFTSLSFSLYLSDSLHVSPQMRRVSRFCLRLCVFLSVSVSLRLSSVSLCISLSFNAEAKSLRPTLTLCLASAHSPSPDSIKWE